MQRPLAWIATMPLAAASVVAGHAAAYRLTGTPLGDDHGYLQHAPQIALVLATVAVLGLAADTRTRRRSPLPLASIGIVAFAVQEHLERFLHTGHVPFLLASPVFWVGVLLQVPLSAALWFLARTVAEDIACVLTRRLSRPTRLPLVHVPDPGLAVVPAVLSRHRVRGPPPPS